MSIEDALASQQATALKLVALLRAVNVTLSRFKDSRIASTEPGATLGDALRSLDDAFDPFRDFEKASPPSNEPPYAGENFNSQLFMVSPSGKASVLGDAAPHVPIHMRACTCGAGVGVHTFDCPQA